MLRSIPAKIIALALALLCANSLVAQDDMFRTVDLDSVTVRARRRTLSVRTTSVGQWQWSVKNLESLPQIMGNADPLHYVQMLPGVQTVGEYQGGMHVMGSDSQHNATTIAGVPVYYASHLLGFFSAFVPSHFSGLTLQHTAMRGDAINRLGGVLDMQPQQTQVDSIAFEGQMGLMSAQGTLKLQLGQRVMAVASARKSYVDALYSHWLRTDDQQLSYTFTDANLTLLAALGQHHSLTADFYMGRDNALLGGDNALASEWGNALAALHWDGSWDNGLSANAVGYYTAYGNDLSINISPYNIGADASIADRALRASASWHDVVLGAEALWHTISPQNISYQSNGERHDFEAESQETAELSAWADYTLHPLDDVELKASLRASLYSIGGQTFKTLSPTLSATCNVADWQVTMAYGQRKQFQHRVGFSDVGLPTEYWLSADQDLRPQTGNTFMLRAEIPLWQRQCRLTIEGYCRRLTNLVEYGGTVLDIVSQGYNPTSGLLVGSGNNIGASLMLSKYTGRFTGWISYQWSRALRHFDQDSKQTYHATHERPHEVNAVAMYTIGHWSLGSTLSACSGTPYTAIESFYFINKQMIPVYGPYNAERLSPYFRLDISATYKWHDRHGWEHGFNFSLYNATAHDNELYRHLRMSERLGFGISSTSFVAPLLPSVSYSIKL